MIEIANTTVLLWLKSPIDLKKTARCTLSLVIDNCTLQLEHPRPNWQHTARTSMLNPRTGWSDSNYRQGSNLWNGLACTGFCPGSCSRGTELEIEHIIWSVDGTMRIKATRASVGMWNIIAHSYDKHAIFAWLRQQNNVGVSAVKPDIWKYRWTRQWTVTWQSSDGHANFAWLSNDVFSTFQ